MTAVRASFPAAKSDRMTICALNSFGATIKPQPMDVPHSDESDLVAAAKTDAGAFATLYELHYQPIANYLFRRTTDVHVTEDLLSEVFFAALRDLPKYRLRGVPFRAWLYRIANNALRKWIRTKQREIRRLQVFVDRSADVMSPTAESQRDGHALSRYVQELPVRHQEVIALFYFENHSVAQIAQVLGVRIGTVKSRLGRAREALRTKYVDCPE
jgi:RNA polymerase sigma-70 factor (ECF subfamily)